MQLIKITKPIKVMSLISMSFFLSLSGIHHLLDPFSLANAIPLFIPFKEEIIFTTGILELIMAIGILIHKWRFYFANSIAIYFFILIGIHIHVAVYQIPMFGISHPLLHWLRTLFQFFLILWVYSLRKIWCCGACNKKGNAFPSLILVI